jgi:hypothetical protein
MNTSAWAESALVMDNNNLTIRTREADTPGADAFWQLHSLPDERRREVLS